MKMKAIFLLLIGLVGALVSVAVAATPETNAKSVSIPNTLGLENVYSDRDYTPLAVCYGETHVEKNLPANLVRQATNLVFTANLLEGDRLFVYDHARGGYVSYRLSAEKMWIPDTTFDATDKSKDLDPTANQTQAWGYGFWVYRPNVTNRTDRVIWLAGQVPVGEVTIELAPSVGSVRGKTLVGNPLGVAWDLNDKSVFDWSTAALVTDHIQLNNDDATVFYWKQDKTTKQYSWVCQTLGKTSEPAVIPAGAAFWYVRAKAGKSPVTISFRTGL